MLGDGQAATNLAQLIELPELVEKDSDAFTQEEVSTFWQHYYAGDVFIGYILLMIRSGMMPGELVQCRKEHINLIACTISGAGLKTVARKKTPIVLADDILPVVAALIEYSSGPKLLTMNKDNFYKEYYAALERAGVRRLPPYSCRHTTGTSLSVDKNIPPTVVKSVLRHSSVAMQERYAHPNVADALNAINK